MPSRQTFMDTFSAVSVAIGNQIHLRSLRDAFSTIITLFILGGVAVLFNNVVFPAVMQGEMLAAWQVWGNAILQGTQNFSAVLLAGMVGFCYARNRHFGNAIGCMLVGISAFVIVIPQSLEVPGTLASLSLNGVPAHVSRVRTTEDNRYALLELEQKAEAATDANANVGDVEDTIPSAVTSLITEQGATIDFDAAADETEEAVASSLDGSGTFFAQAFTTNELGSGNLFVAILMGLVASEVFIRLSQFKRLRLYLGEGVPPAVASTFSVMLPMCITLMGCGVVAACLAGFFGTSIPALIDLIVQQPLRIFVGENIWGASLIFGIGMFLFTLGIHQTTINGVLLTPIMQVLLNENTEAFSQGLPYTFENYNYLNYDTQAVFGTMGGSGCTIGLIIATFLFSRSHSARAVCALGLVPGIFEINEPIIYGYPIVYNLPLMVGFVLCSLIGYVGSYFMTIVGLMRPCVITVAWTTPPFINSFLATAGDFRAPVCQLALVIIITVVYTIFMKVAEVTGSGFSDTDVMGDDLIGVIDSETDATSI